MEDENDVVEGAQFAILDIIAQLSEFQKDPLRRSERINALPAVDYSPKALAARSVISSANTYGGPGRFGGSGSHIITGGAGPGLCGNPRVEFAVKATIQVIVAIALMGGGTLAGKIIATYWDTLKMMGVPEAVIAVLKVVFNSIGPTLHNTVTVAKSIASTGAAVGDQATVILRATKGVAGAFAPLTQQAIILSSGVYALIPASRSYFQQKIESLRGISERGLNIASEIVRSVQGAISQAKANIDEKKLIWSETTENIQNAAIQAKRTITIPLDNYHNLLYNKICEFISDPLNIDKNFENFAFDISGGKKHTRISRRNHKKLKSRKGNKKSKSRKGNKKSKSRRM
jgi:hypothetical protein